MSQLDRRDTEGREGERRRRVSRGRERVAKEHEKGAERRGRDGWKIGERSTEGENENG